MITINLLPAELRPVKRTPLPYFIVLVITVLAGILCTKMYLKDASDLENIQATLLKNEVELETHMEDIEKYKKLVAKQKHLAAKLTTINEIASDRLIWSFHLATLARLAPDNLWYDTIEVTSRTIPETITITDSKTGKPVKKQIKKVIPILKLTGFISPDDLGRTDINPFLSVLENDEDFSSMFQLEPPTLNYKDFGGRNVRTFILNCVISPRTGESE